MRASGTSDAYTESFTLTHNTSTTIQIAGYNGVSDIDLTEAQYALRIKLTDQAGNSEEVADALTFDLDLTALDLDTLFAESLTDSIPIVNGLVTPYGVDDNVLMTFV